MEEYAKRIVYVWICVGGVSFCRSLLMKVPEWPYIARVLEPIYSIFIFLVALGSAPLVIWGIFHAYIHFSERWEADARDREQKRKEEEAKEEMERRELEYEQMQNEKVREENENEPEKTQKEEKIAKPKPKSEKEVMDEALRNFLGGGH